MRNRLFPKDPQDRDNIRSRLATLPFSIGIALIFLLITLCGPFVPAHADEKYYPTGLCDKIPFGKRYRAKCNLGEARSCTKESRVIAALYHYFYDFIDEFREDGFTHQPVSWEDFSHTKWRWHRDELRDMVNAGISIAAIDWQMTPKLVGLEDGTEQAPAPDSSSWQISGLLELLKGYRDLGCGGRKPPALAPYINTDIFDPDRNPFTQNGINLRTLGSLEFAFRSIAGFYCVVPPETWAKIDGKPIVFYGSIDRASEVESNFFEQLNDSFEAHFGLRLYFIKQRETLDHVAKVDPKSLNLATRLLREQLTYEDVIFEILASDEFYLQSGGTDETFLKNVVWKLFERNEPVDSALQPWTQWVTSTQRKEQLKEFLSDRMADVYGAFIARWYKQFIGQEEPFKELLVSVQKDRHLIREARSWIGMLERGIHYDTIRAEILASSVFYKKAGNSPEIFVRRLYETLFYRCPTNEEISPWIEFMTAHQKKRKINVSKGMRREVATRLLADREAKRLDVFWLVAHFLHRTPGWPGFADAVFSDKGALCHTFTDVASIGPGFDNSNVPSEVTEYRDHRGGSYYSEAWKKILAMDPKPMMVFIQSWNNFHQATELARSKQFGQDFISMTRSYNDAYQQTGFMAGEGRCP